MCPVCLGGIGPSPSWELCCPSGGEWPAWKLSPWEEGSSGVSALMGAWAPTSSLWRTPHRLAPGYIPLLSLVTLPEVSLSSHILVFNRVNPKKIHRRYTFLKDCSKEHCLDWKNQRQYKMKKYLLTPKIQLVGCNLCRLCSCKHGLSFIQKEEWLRGKNQEPRR